MLSLDYLPPTDRLHSLQQTLQPVSIKETLHPRPLACPQLLVQGDVRTHVRDPTDADRCCSVAVFEVDVREKLDEFATEEGFGGGGCVEGFG